MKALSIVRTTAVHFGTFHCYVTTVHSTNRCCGDPWGLRPPSGGHAPQTWLQKYYPRYSKMVNHHPKHTAKLRRPTNAHTRDLNFTTVGELPFFHNCSIFPLTYNSTGNKQIEMTVYLYVCIISKNLDLTILHHPQV